jgi:protein ImuB
LTRALATPEPQAVVEDHRVLACDGKAAARGVRPGMAAATARALAHDLVARARSPAEETESLLGLAGWAAQYTPSVAIDGETVHAGLVLEVSGSLRLFGGLERILAGLREGCALMGFTALAAAAPTARGAAWLARAGIERVIAHPNLLAAALEALPLSVAVHDAAVREALTAVGAGTIGDVMRLPRDGLARRFGQPLLDEIDRAFGRRADPRAFYVPPPAFHARLELPAEVTQTESLLFAAKRLFVQLAGFLAARSGGVRRIELRLFHREARMTAVPIGLVAPSRDAGHFTLLARERLGTVALQEPVRSLALAADDIVPLEDATGALFADDRTRPGDWPQLVERLRARLGGAAVHGLAAASDHRPELASHACEVAAEKRAPRRAAKAKRGTAGDAAAPFGLRPFWLLSEPRPLEEIGDLPHYGGPLKLLAGPERIETGWWDGTSVARDYFVAQTAARTLVWVFRTRGEAPGWFLHGTFG